MIFNHAALQHMVAVTEFLTLLLAMFIGTIFLGTAAFVQWMIEKRMETGIFFGVTVDPKTPIAAPVVAASRTAFAPSSSSLRLHSPASSSSARACSCAASST